MKAREDFAFGRKQCERALKDDPALHVSFDEVQLFAEGLSAAAALLRAGDESVLADAVTFADLLIQCQQQDAPDWEIPLYGFYYTDRTHRLPLHHAHHSFEQYTTVGLEMLLKACPEHEHAARWRAALQRSADYYRALSSFTEPYGILPEGVYFADEAERWPEETLRHIIWGDEACLRDFRPQVENGFCLDRASQVYLRVFPVWFSFRGNCNVQLSEAVAAASAGTAVGDLRLLEIARRQLAWITGMNPFGQSLLYGEGPEWTDEYTVQSGVTVGQIPVGMQTYQHHDVPWWPQVTTATYKEVWIASALKWMWTLSYILDES